MKTLENRTKWLLTRRFGVILRQTGARRAAWERGDGLAAQA
jgi:hypothetical protein